MSALLIEISAPSGERVWTPVAVIRGGLAVTAHRYPSGNFAKDRWDVTHIASGYGFGLWPNGVPRNGRTLRSAKRLLEVLLRESVDWRKSRARLLKPLSDDARDYLSDLAELAP